MLIQQQALVTAISVDDALADLRALKSQSTSSSSAKVTKNPDATDDGHSTEGLLALGRKLLASNSSSIAGPSAGALTITDLASFDAALDTLFPAPSRRSQGEREEVTAPATMAKANTAAVEAARYYIQICSDCLRFDGSTLLPGSSRSQKVSDTAFSRPDIDPREPSHIDRMYKQVAEMQSRTDEAVAQLKTAIERLEALSKR
ncbi:hypothetical protein K437DRAFT_267738 [Tilletiaria anomala UBC 951]|uniref:Uncharacterized protein n=1 Tax=Tilletiaria anomala (strain ATCC 24038 / CBS 436.72 / UBC 951) TaxID=1037660 RepID=A0A066W1Y8_TILAU|nr:uncharacterized protein K437DRAFT_267738 [Tilletiaria anomala UBC 951]KDN47967.1 hypothetical protein K437DRAFT_267738 [Tilletiaria anomala UBC 951]